MLVGLQTGEGHERCDGSCERRGVHTAYHAFECPRCEPVRNDGWPMYLGDSLPIPNLLNSEGQDLAILPNPLPRPAGAGLSTPQMGLAQAWPICPDITITTIDQ